MSSLLERHPERDLVCYIDGELSERHRGKVASHLESCGRCRAEVDELQNSLAECVSYRNVRSAQMPEAPQPWRDLYRDFSRIDESLANTSLLGRLLSPLVHSGVPRWAVVAGLAGLIVLLSLNQLRQAPSVQAATLLRKAVEFSQSQPRPVRRIRVRSSRQPEFTKLTGAQASPGRRSPRRRLLPRYFGRRPLGLERSSERPLIRAVARPASSQDRRRDRGAESAGTVGAFDPDSD